MVRGEKGNIFGHPYRISILNRPYGWKGAKISPRPPGNWILNRLYGGREIFARGVGNWKLNRPYGWKKIISGDHPRIAFSIALMVEDLRAVVVKSNSQTHNIVRGRFVPTDRQYVFSGFIS